MVSGEPDAHFISDFQYFVFTKSTKSLESIRTLLKIGHIEDVFILLRTMFEGYDFLANILTLFVFTKIFESIVTVEGEDFQSPYVEKECYKLVEEVTEYLFYQLEYFSKYECKDVNPELNKHMKDMFKNMKKSLKEELGSVNKKFLN